MSKKFFMIPLVVGIIFSSPLQADCFYQHTSLDVNEKTLSNEQRSLLYLSCGYSNLISQRYCDAFEDYQKAFDILQDSKNSGMDFLISFGMAVVCDNLHLTNDSQRYVLRIRKLIDAGDEEESSSGESISQDERQVMNYFSQLACLSSSMETRNTLLSFVSEVFSSSLTSCSSSSLSPKLIPSLLSQKIGFEVNSCRSFWKTLKKIRDSIVETWNCFFEIYQDIKEIRDDLNGNQRKLKEIMSDLGGNQ